MQLLKSSFVLMLGALSLAGAARLAHAQGARDFHLVTSNFPPFAVDSDPGAPGAFVEVTQLLAKRLAVDIVDTRFLPWTRAQLVVQNQPRTLILPLDRTPERESKYRWLAMLLCRPVGFVRLRAVQAPLGALESMRDTRVGVLRTSSYAEQLKAMHFSHAIEVESYDDLVRLLKLSAFESIYTSQDVILRSMKANGLREADIVLGKPVGYDHSWLAASLDVPETEVEHWRQALALAHKDGTVERLLASYDIKQNACPTEAR